MGEDEFILSTKNGPIPVKIAIRELVYYMLFIYYRVYIQVAGAVTYNILV